jgi:hypothetical protein
MAAIQLPAHPAAGASASLLRAGEEIGLGTVQDAGDASASSTSPAARAAADATPQYMRRWGAWTRQRRFLLARVGWLALVGPAVVVYLTNLPTYGAAMRAICQGNGCVPGQLSSDGARLLAQHGISLQTFAMAAVICNLATTLVWWAVGLLLFWRASQDRMALLVALALMLVGAIVPTNQQALAWRWPTQAVNFASLAVLFLVFCLFPNGRFVPGWLRGLPLAYLVLSALDFFPQLSLALGAWLQPVHVVLLFACCGLLIAAQLYRYGWVSTADERRQTKYVVVGFSATLVGEFLYWLATLILPGLQPPTSLYALLLSPASAMVLALCIPLSIGLAILRERLYAIELLLKWTVVYGALTLILAALYAGGTGVVGSLLLTFTGQQTLFATVVVSIAVGVLADPLRRLLMKRIDRALFRPKYAADRQIDAFEAKVRDTLDPEMEPEQLEHTLERELGRTWASIEPRLVALHESHESHEGHEGHEELLRAQRNSAPLED